MILDTIIISNIELGWILFIRRIIINTPAVTKVDECTKAEIGVGAAMAMGNQAEKGYWALFEKLAVTNSNSVIMLYLLFIWKFQFLFIIIILIDRIIKISPIRFLINVIDPDAAVM